MGDVVSLFGGKVDTTEFDCDDNDNIKVKVIISMTKDEVFTYSVLADSMEDTLLLVGMLDTVKRLLQQSLGDVL